MNPRDPFGPNGFQDRRLQPLGHSSALILLHLLTTLLHICHNIRMQKGHTFQRHGAWHLRYRSSGKQVCVKLTDYSDEYRTLKSVRPLAERHLQPVNQGLASDPQTVQQFIDLVHLSHVELHRRPSTVKGYRNLYNRYIRSQVAGVRLFGFRTRDGQGLLNRVATEHKLAHLTLIHVKSFLSGVFTFAKRVGSLDSSNPMQGVEVRHHCAMQPHESTQKVGEMP